MRYDDRQKLALVTVLGVFGLDEHRRVRREIAAHESFREVVPLIDLPVTVTVPEVPRDGQARVSAGKLNQLIGFCACAV